MTAESDVAPPALKPPPTVVPPEAPARPRAGWSFGILVVAALRLFDAIGLILITLDIARLPLTGMPVLGDEGVTYWLNLAYATLIIIGVVGLLLRQGWGWVLTMILVGLGLVGEIIRYVDGTPDPLGLAVLVVSAFYLNQRSVRAVAAGLLHDDD